MKSMGDDLKVGDVVEEPNARGSDLPPLRYVVTGMEHDEEGRPTFEIEEIDPGDSSPRSTLWAIASAVLTGLVTYLFL
ncbi:MAG: hypothetical protein V3T08_10050 [Gemmatimonadota bacterium]